VDKAFSDKILQRIVAPTIAGLQKDRLPYKGFIFIGLIRVGDDPFVIEYNVRLGDPETEVVIPRIKNDLVAVFRAVANGTLPSLDLETDERTAATVMAVSGGYPEAYQKGMEISGLDKVKDSLVFHAGTQLKDSRVYTSGGRVIALTSFGKDFREAVQMSYQSLERIHFEKMYYRKDIGFDL
jgi:phosphoribosylamine--glycine ligase